jgi:hypothetical protein
MTVHDDAATEAPVPTVPPLPAVPPVAAEPAAPAASAAPTVRDVLASCAAARTVSTPPSPAEPSTGTGPRSESERRRGGRDGGKPPGASSPREATAGRGTASA